MEKRPGEKGFDNDKERREKFNALKSLAERKGETI